MSLFPSLHGNTECLDALFRKLSQIFWANVVRRSDINTQEKRRLYKEGRRKKKKK